MKLNQTASKITLSALLASGLSLSALVAGTKGEVAKRLDNVSRLELPAEAVAIMKGAPRNVRLAKAIETVRVAAEIAPYSVASVVKALCKAEPSFAPDIAVIAAQSLTEKGREKRMRYISSSAISSAPMQTQKIVSGLAKAFPNQAEEIFLGASYKKSDEVFGLGVLGLRDADPNIFGVQNRKVASELSADQIDQLRGALMQLLGGDAQEFTVDVRVIGVSLGVVNAIVEAIAESGAVTSQNFATLIQEVVNQAANADGGSRAQDILRETLTDLGVSATEADSITADAAMDGSALEVAVQNSQAVVELVTVTVEVNPDSDRSYSGSTSN